MGARLIPQATTFIYDTGFPLLDILKIAPYDFRIRTAQGVGVIYNPFTHWSVGVDLLYSLQGGGYEGRQTQINYLKMPLWLGYNASPTRTVIFNIQLGVDLAYVVSASMKYEDGPTVDLRNYVNRTNWGVPAAIGVKFKVLESWYVNTQLFLYADFVSLAKTNSTFDVRDYILPGIRLSIDRELKVDW